MANLEKDQAFLRELISVAGEVRNFMCHEENGVLQQRRALGEFTAKDQKLESLIKDGRERAEISPTVRDFFEKIDAITTARGSDSTKVALINFWREANKATLSVQGKQPTVVASRPVAAPSVSVAVEATL